MNIAEKYAAQYMPNGEVSLADLIQAAINESESLIIVGARERIRDLEWAVEQHKDNALALHQRIRELEAQPVAVVGEPVGFVLLHKNGGRNLTFHDNTGELSDEWSQHQLVIQPTHSIPAAELATLREKAAMADELQKDAEKWRDLCSRVGADPSGTVSYAGPLEGAPEDWAAIAQEGK